MKIQKGKLNASHAVLISVLLIVLYLVLPTSKDQKAKTQANAAPADSGGTGQAPPESSTGNVLRPDHETDVNQAGVVTTPVASAPPSLKNLAPLKEEDLDLLKQQNPFFTIAMIPKSEPQRPNDDPQETSPAENSQTQLQNFVNPPKISLVYKSTTGKHAAILDDKVVYSGTVITGDVRVMSISEQGVQLSP